MPDRETWRFINTFAPWFSALGTLTAVIVSLYLARRAARLHVRTSLSIINVVNPGQELAQAPEFLQIAATNHGDRDAVIRGIMWKQRWPKRKMWVQFPPANPYSTKLPARLTFGEEAQFLFDTSTFNKDAGF
jgi:hypothetical protein